MVLLLQLIQNFFGMLEQFYDPNGENKWFNSPVIHYSGTLDEISIVIPSFERIPFDLGDLRKTPSRLNKRLDLIVRKPHGEDKCIIPIGTVSKDYSLVQHSEIIEIASRAFNKVSVDLKDCKTNMVISEYGERMNLSIHLPEQYSFDPGDGHKMDLRIECYNSVDGSSKFRALLGWFRLVCSNGLVVGITESDIRKRHYKDMTLPEVESVLLNTLKNSSVEKDNFIKWRNQGITQESLKRWIIDTLWKKWGFKAAARAYHISQHGYDVYVSGGFKSNNPFTIPVIKSRTVPGTPERCTNLFELSQILAWLSKERRDIQEQLEWKESIPELLEFFLN